MQTLKDFKERIVGPKYHHNLLGESLSDLLRKATAKTLVTPDEETNQQVSSLVLVVQRFSVWIRRHQGCLDHFIPSNTLTPVNL